MLSFHKLGIIQHEPTVSLLCITSHNNLHRFISVLRLSSCFDHQRIGSFSVAIVFRPGMKLLLFTYVSRPALTHRQLLLESICDTVLSASICLQLPIRSQHSSLTSISLPLLRRTSSSQHQVSKLWPESMATKISSVVSWEASSDVALANRRATMVKISLFHFRSSISWYFRF